MSPDYPAPASQAPFAAELQARIRADGGWWPFDRFMAAALYTPGRGYYANASRKFGSLPQSGSDFVTAPELSPCFGAALAAQVRQALDASGSASVWEFGAGTGALAEQLLATLGDRVQRYTIVDLSGVLRERQRERLAPWAGRVALEWVDALPAQFEGVVVGNEVLDAMPVQLLRRAGSEAGAAAGSEWLERGVVPQGEGFAWQDRPTRSRPPRADEALPGHTTELHLQAEGFIRTLADRLTRGAAFFIDYGFPEDEYYHPQRHGGTLMCHRAHKADTDPLTDVGQKDITAHVNFTGIALAGQEAGLEVIGYTSQARFLLNCGLLQLLPPADGSVPELQRLREVAAAQKLLGEHEMGELFKVIGFARGVDLHHAVGFSAGDRTHML